MAKELFVKVSTEKHIQRWRQGIYRVCGGGFPKDEVFNDAFINSRVEDIVGAMVPKVLGIECRDGRWTIIREYVEGETLADLMRKEPEKKYEYLETMLDLQLKLHNYRAHRLHQLKLKMQQQINDLNGIDESTRYELR